MPIDEAESIGSNYETLRQLAFMYNYQIISMSIRRVEGMRGNEKNTYELVPNPDETVGINYPPFAVLTCGHKQIKRWESEDA